MDTETIRCRRCGEDEAPKMARPPFKNELGGRIQAEICQQCWSEWLEHQTLLINHYGLDPRDRKAREFLYQQIEAVLFDEGDADDVDTSREGEIQW